jgi:hypothetical protein
MVDRSSGKQGGRAGGVGVQPGVPRTYPPALLTHRMLKNVSVRPEGSLGPAVAPSALIEVEDSCRFNDDDSPRLFRTPSVVGNRRVGSLSLWYKRCNLGSIMQLFNSGAGDDIAFDAADQLIWTDGSGLSYKTTQVFRDPTAWGHLLFAWDTNLAAAGNRARIYHNGVEITSFATETNPDQFDELEISNIVRQTIGANESNTEEFDGYLSEIHYVDGKQLLPTSFGEFDDNGVWRPIAYSATTTTPAISHVSNAVDASNGTAYTFSSQALGAAATDRRIVVAVGSAGNTTGTASAVTVGGVSATQVAEYTDSVNTSSIWWAEVPTGTTGDVVVTFTGGKSDCGIVCYRLTGADMVLSRATDGTGTSSPEAFSGTVGTPNNAVVIANVMWNGTAQRTTAWTGGVTEDVDQVVEDAALADKMQSTSSTTSSGATVIATATPSGTTTNEALTVVAFGSSAHGVNGFHLDFADENNPGLDANVAVSTTTYRYLKIDVTEVENASYVSIGEMEYFVGATLYPTQTMSSNTLPSPLVASANSDTGTGAQLAFNAFDDNKHPTVSKWQTANGTVTGFLKIDLGSGNGIAPTRIGIFAPETQNRAPRDFTIQGSNNDSDYTILATYAANDTWASQEQRYFPLSNGNNLADSGLATNDQVSDTPTNNYPTINTLSAYDNNHTYSNGNLQLIDTNNGTNDTSRISTIAIPKGSDTWAVKMTCVNALAGHAIGVGDQNTVTGDVQGFNQSGVHGVWYNQLGTVYINGSSSATGKATLTSANDVIECHVDMSAGDVEFFVNNSSQGSFALPSGYEDSGVDLFFHCDTGVVNNTLSFDFGQSGYNPATNLAGSKRLSTANLAAPTISDGTAHFQATLYTGNGSARNIDQTGNSTFQPDFVWIKNRDQADPNMLYTSVLGVQKDLNIDDNTSANTNANGLTSFDSDGFGVGSGAGGYNDNTEKFVAYQWKGGGGAGASIEAGTINTIATSVNATAGISVGTYTGTGSAATIGHGLGAVPHWIMTKNTAAAGLWVLYHQHLTSAPETDYLQPHLTNATADFPLWNDTAPTSSVFSIGTDGSINTSDQIYNFWAFTEIDGFSKFGTYEGNANNDGPFVYCGFKPAWLWIKNFDTAQQWHLYDNVKSTYNSGTTAGRIYYTTEHPYAEVSAAENIDFLANGFKIRDNNIGVNQANTMIFMAFAEYPFGGDGVSPATAV